MRRKFLTFLVILVLLASPLAILQFVPNVKAQEPLGSNPSSNVASLTGLPIQFEEKIGYVKLNFTMFVIEFYKGSTGYNKIYYKNGSVLVYDDRIILEYLSKATDTWKQRGTPTGISYEKISDYYYNVTRFYTDYLGTTYNVTYIIKSDSAVKTSISLKSGDADTYRIAWYSSGITQFNYIEEQNRVVFGNEAIDYDWVGFDWKDVYEQLGNITQTSYEDVAKGKKANIYFNIGTASTGQIITIDPSTVGTSTCAFPISYSHQRKGFYANTRFWVFYSDGTDMVYKTSTDGTTWSSATSVTACTNGYMFSIWFDGTYFHYAYAAFGTSIYYRKGLPNSDGTTTWSAVEQTVVTTYNKAYYPFVSTDSDGYAWVGYADKTGTSCYPYIIKSQYNNGSWGTTPAGFPYKLSTTASGSYGIPNWRISIIPLTVLKMVAIYAYSGITARVQSWNGTAWNIEVATASTTYLIYHSAVAQDDYVHLTFINSSVSQTWIIYVKYTYSTNSFGAETTITEVAPSSPSAPVISIDDSNNLYVFTIGQILKRIYYYKWNGTNWVPKVDWITELVDFTSNDRLSCFYKQYGSYIGLVYGTGGSSPYNVRFAYLTFAGAKAWHDVSTWTASLVTKTWASGTSWLFDFGTRIWVDAATWTYNWVTMDWQNISWIFSLGTSVWTDIAMWGMNLSAMMWNDVATWVLYPITRLWNDVAIYAFNLLTMAWHDLTWLFTLLPALPEWVNVAVWIFHLAPAEWIFPFIWIIMVGFIGLCCLVLSAKPQKKRETENV